MLERAGGTLDTTQKNPGAVSAPGLAIANPNLSDAAITAAGGLPGERSLAVADYNAIWVAYDSIPLLADTIGVKKLNWKLLTDYTVQSGRLRGLRVGVAANFVDQNLAGYRSGDTVANPNYDKSKAVSTTNLPYIDDRYARFGDHVEDLVDGFESYARFLLSICRQHGAASLLVGFAGLAVRKVVRPTQFYYMLLHRLRNDRTMDDGVSWSAQADFLAR